MNIQAQCCGIVLILVLFLFYFRQKNLKLNTEKAFQLIACATLLCVSLDILSIIVITYMEVLSQKLVIIICKSYLASLLSVTVCCLVYISMELNVRIKAYRKVLPIYFFIAAIGFFTIFLLPIRFYVRPEEDALYTYGPSVLATYIFCLLFLVSIFVILILQKKCINKRRWEAVMTWMGIWLAAAFIQFLNNKLLIIGFAGCVGVMVLYLKLENPETNLDRKTGIFNQTALAQYISELYHKKTAFSVISVSFEQSVNQGISSTVQDLFEMKIIDYLSSVPDSKIFKNAEDEIIIILMDKETSDQWADTIRQHFETEAKQSDGISYELSIVFVPDACLVHKAEDLFYLLRYIRQNNTDYAADTLLVADENVVTKMYRNKEVKQLILRAIDSDLVEVFYQPIYSTCEDRFTSAEALVRIRDENGNIIPPGVFIHVAEESGLITKLGEIVFQKVCRFIKENRIKQYGIQYIEVNLSMVQCADEHLADNYIAIMEQYKVNPGMINLEITESASLNAKKILLDNMKCLMNYGASFSLDDFGTGQSNLNYIVEMPVDIVKFDKNMIHAYFENAKAKYVMDAAMHMIHGMELKIVSEGIETEQQYQTMKNLGISYIQGYYFSKPLPPDEFLEFLDKQNL